MDPQPEAPRRQLPEFDASTPFPDFYADSVQVGIGPYGITLSFGLSRPEQPSLRQVVGRVRLSPQMAYVMTQLLRRGLRQAQADGLGITVPDAVLREVGVEKESL